MQTTTPHIALFKSILIKLENVAETLLQCFKDNIIKANPDNYRLLINNIKEHFQIKKSELKKFHNRKLNERINHIY